jgi:hypothetical protein
MKTRARNENNLVKMIHMRVVDDDELKKKRLTNIRSFYAF